MQILLSNVIPGQSQNFVQTTANGVDLGAYDFGSIMHYPAYAFSANGQPTILTIPPGIPIGQRESLSGGDIAGIRALYNAPSMSEVRVTIATNPPGQPLIVDGTVAPAPFTAAWQKGSQHTVSAGNPPSSTSRAVFASWSDGGMQSHTLTVGSESIITASYSIAQALSVENLNSRAGTVTISPLSPDGFYALNTSVILRAAAAPGFCFAGWDGLIPGTPPEIALVMSKPYSVSAAFLPGTFTLGSYTLADSGAGGDYSTEINGPAGCAWTASSMTPWIHLQTRSGSGNSVVMFRLETNSTDSPRAGYIVIGGQMFSVLQAAN